jgi:hypothetical protein
MRCWHEEKNKNKNVVKRGTMVFSNSAMKKARFKQNKGFFKTGRGDYDGLV